MPKITYIEPHGERHEEDIPVGFSLMEGAFNRNIPGILGECGGGAACATCHGYISDEWLKRIPPIEDLEEAMLCMAIDRRPNSRLTCQIHVTDDLDGIEIEIAESQGF